MIKNFISQQYEGVNGLPTYVNNLRIYTLTGEIAGGYTITLAKLTVGDSISAGNELTHALFESFTDHGKRAKAARTRASGYDREFSAIKNAMAETGVEFEPTAPCHSEALLRALGTWFLSQNPDIQDFAVVSQRCH